MPIDEIKKWLNENQGVVAVIIFVLTVFFAWTSGLFRWLFRKKVKPNFNIDQSIKAQGGIAVGSKNATTVNIGAIHISGLEQVNNMAQTLQTVLNAMKPSSDIPNPPPKPTSEDFKRVVELTKGEPSEDKKKELRIFFYSSNDPLVRLQSVLSLTNWFDILNDSIDDLISLCDEGIIIAESMTLNREKAVLLAYKGHFVTLQFTKLDMGTAYGIKRANLLGIPFITEEKKQDIIKKLQGLDELSEKCFIEAEKAAKLSRSNDALGMVYGKIGEAAGQRYLYLQDFVPERATQEKQLCKSALLLARDIFFATGDERDIAYSLHNLANQLRFFGEAHEARILSEKVVEIATRLNDQRLLTKSKRLLNSIITGKVPDYVHGER